MATTPDYTLQGAADTANYLLDELGVREAIKLSDLKETYAGELRVTDEEDYWRIVGGFLRTVGMVPQGRCCEG
jgi:hypothetical protein